MSTTPFPQWCEAAPEAEFSPPGDCAERANAFERRIKRRNLFEYLAGLLIFAVCGPGAMFAFGKGEFLIAISLVLMMIGTGIVMWNLHKRGSNLVRRPEDPCLTHLRRQYQRQYEALRSVPKWYLGPLVPGMAMFYFVSVAKSAEIDGWAAATSGAMVPVLATIALFGGVALLNWRGANVLKGKMASLDDLA
uniref:hypothetical protein n=1 Tax=uncultured Erythrobacter sp. TaxID=263913 RepID=UPI002616553E|nr:hypothetical protein [uncultured Erythrobacter sp.]